MILSNYWKYFLAVGNIHYIVGSNITKPTGCKDTAGNANIGVVTGTAGASNAISKNLSIRENLTFLVGSGTTDPTSEDYQMEQDETANITNYQASFVFSSSSDSYKMIVSVSGMNNTASAITLTEVGIAKGVFDQNEQDNTRVLFVRHKLDTPVEIPAGGNFAFTFEWSEG